MRCLLHDTNLYIDWLNAGAHAVRDRIRLHDLFRTFGKLGWRLVPSAKVYEDAGGVLRQLQAAHG